MVLRIFEVLLQKVIQKSKNIATSMKTNNKLSLGNVYSKSRYYSCVCYYFRTRELEKPTNDAKSITSTCISYSVFLFCITIIIVNRFLFPSSIQSQVGSGRSISEDFFITYMYIFIEF